MGTLREIAEHAVQQKWKGRIMFFSLFLLGINYLFYSFFALAKLKSYVRIVAIALLVFHCLLRLVASDLKQKDLALCICAVVLLLMNGSVAFNLVALILLIVEYQSIKMRYVYQCAASVSLILLMVVLCALAFGLVDNQVYSVANRHRLTMGFVNVNNASAFAFSLMNILFLSKKKSQRKSVFMYVVVTLIVYILTDSRTAFFAALVFLGLWLLIYRLPVKSVRVSVLALTMLMFLLVFIWGIPALSEGKINEVLSLRPECYLGYIRANNALNFLFGGSSAREVDNSYLLLLYNGGIFIYIAVAVVTAVALDVMVRARRYAEVCFCIALLTYGQFEGLLVRPEILCVPVFWTCVAKYFSVKELKKTAIDIFCSVTENSDHRLKKRNEDI